VIKYIAEGFYMSSCDGSGIIKEREEEMAHHKNKKSRWKTLTHKKHSVEFVGISKKGIKCLTK